MTNNTDPVRALPTQWRHNAQGCSRHEAHAAGTWRSCARELESALATAPPSAPVGGNDALVAGAMEAAADACTRHVVCNEAIAAAVEYALSQQPAAEFRNDGGSEAEFIAHHADACTACGGSGHKADQQPADVDEAIRAAVEAEREACAKACDDRAAYYHAGDDDGPNTRRGMACEACASVIRWRGTVSPSFLAKHEAEIAERLAAQQQGGRADG